MVDFAAANQRSAEESDPFNENFSGAIISDDGVYRYLLWRGIQGEVSGRRLLFVMVNPSTADAHDNDPTVLICMAIARALGFSGIEIVNLFGFRSSQPKDLKSIEDPIGRLNEIYIAQAARRADTIICAWGNNTDLVPGEQDKRVLELLTVKLGKAIHHRGLTAKGHPKHPLARGTHRIPNDFQPVLWLEPALWALRNPKAAELDPLDDGKRHRPLPDTRNWNETMAWVDQVAAEANEDLDRRAEDLGVKFDRDRVVPLKDTVCSICGEPQFSTPSGNTCFNKNGGHGGVPSMTRAEFFMSRVKEAPSSDDNPFKDDRPALVAVPLGPGESGKPEEPEPRSDLAPEPPPWEPSKDQTAALDGIMGWWDKNPADTSTLGGYAGTGKTTLMGKLAYDLLSADVRVVFATPTGKAAQVLTRSLQTSGVLSAAISTIHSLIYIPDADPKTGRIRGWKRRKTLDADLIVLDEASMVTRKMLDDLEYFRVPILAVGDHGQLPPVSEKAFLMAQPDFRLEKIHRQAKGNPIIRLATHMRKGAPPEAWRRLIDDLQDDRVQYTNMEAIGRAFGAPPGMAITYTNRLRSDINNEMRDEVHGLSDEMGPQPGEIVICLKNQKLDESGLSVIANGMRGVVKACRPDDNSDHMYCMNIEFDEPVGLVEDLKVNKSQFGRHKTFKGWDEVPGDHRNWWTVGALFDYGYALTCHKAQGSQADNVAVFMEEWALQRMSEEDRRRWVYTATTRSAERVMLVF